MEQGPGKVTRICFDREEFTAQFLGEPDITGPSITEEQLPFILIEEIITDRRELAKLEKEFSADNGG